VILEKLYGHVRHEEEEIEKNEDGGIPPGPAKNFKERKISWMRKFAKLYPTKHYGWSSKGRLVGPVGERPLHVCAILAARYRAGGESKGVLLAQAIFEGMRAFTAKGAWRDEMRFTYRRDYCAAVGRYVFNAKAAPAPDLALPYFPLLREWCTSRLAPTGRNWQRHARHIKAIVTKGLYQGQTLLFPFIASGHPDAVRWLLREYARPPPAGLAPLSADQDLRCAPRAPRARRRKRSTSPLHAVHRDAVYTRTVNVRMMIPHRRVTECAGPARRVSCPVQALVSRRRPRGSPGTRSRATSSRRRPA
jgi:hypothetical protein